MVFMIYLLFTLPNKYDSQGFVFLYQIFSKSCAYHTGSNHSYIVVIHSGHHAS